MPNKKCRQHVIVTALSSSMSGQRTQTQYGTTKSISKQRIVGCNVFDASNSDIKLETKKLASSSGKPSNPFQQTVMGGDAILRSKCAKMKKRGKKRRQRGKPKRRKRKTRRKKNDNYGNLRRPSLFSGMNLHPLGSKLPMLLQLARLLQKIDIRMLKTARRTRTYLENARFSIAS